MSPWRPARNEGQIRRGTELEPRGKEPTLADLGVSKKTSSLVQKLAGLPVEQFEQVKAGTASVAQAIREVTHAQRVRASPIRRALFTDRNLIVYFVADGSRRRWRRFNPGLPIQAILPSSLLGRITKTAWGDGNCIAILVRDAPFDYCFSLHAAHPIIVFAGVSKRSLIDRGGATVFCCRFRRSGRELNWFWGFLARGAAQPSWLVGEDGNRCIFSRLWHWHVAPKFLWAAESDILEHARGWRTFLGGALKFARTRWG